MSIVHFSEGTIKLVSKLLGMYEGFWALGSLATVETRDNLILFLCYNTTVFIYFFWNVASYFAPSTEHLQSSIVKISTNRSSDYHVSSNFWIFSFPETLCQMQKILFILVSLNWGDATAIAMFQRPPSILNLEMSQTELARFKNKVNGNYKNDDRFCTLSFDIVWKFSCF